MRDSFSPIRTICPNHLISHDLMARKIAWRQIQILRFSFHNINQPLLFLSILNPNICLCTLFCSKNNELVCLTRIALFQETPREKPPPPLHRNKQVFDTSHLFILLSPFLGRYIQREVLVAKIQKHEEVNFQCRSELASSEIIRSPMRYFQKLH